MVGFIQEPIPHEEESGTKQEKFKTSKYPETFRLDFDEFSLSSIDSFLDLDFAPINEWINDVQAPEDVELSKFEIGCMDNLIGNSLDLELDNLVQDMNQSEKSVSIKAECVGSAEHIDCSMDKSDGYVMEDFVKKTELGSSEIAEINSDCHPGETKISPGDNERINDMQAPEDVQLSKSEIGSGVDDLVGNSLDNLVQGMNQSEKSVSAKVKCIGSAELGSSETAEINSDGHHGETKISPGDGSVGLLDEKDCCKLENLNCSIEEELQKVNLGGDRHKSAVIDIKKEITPVLSEETASDSKSDNECDSASSSSASSSSSSTSSSSSSSSSGSDDDSENDDEEDNDNKYDESGEEFSFKDDVVDGDSYMKKGAIRSQNEITVLPRVDEVNVTLLPHQEILPVGVISSVLGNQVIVEGSEKHTPLDDSSILWITETRLPLGRVDEIFGPVENPYYIVRYNSENDIPSDIQSGTLIGFVPEFVKYVLESEARKKGSDASGPNDEEVMNELEFSDDEEEAEFKRTLKTSKRGNSNQDPRPSGNKRKNNKSKNKTRTKDQPCTSHSPTKQPTQTSQMQQHAGPRVPSASESNQFGPTSIGSDFFGRPAVPSIAQGYQPGPSPMGPFFPRGPSLFPQQLQQAGFLVNGILQQLNMAMPVNSMPPAQWQQQHYSPQMPPTNPALFQQPYIGLQGPSSQFPITPAIPSNSFQAPSFQGNETVPPQFNQGLSSGRGGSGRGRGRTPFHRRGGRFGGGRGRHQAN